MLSLIMASRPGSRQIPRGRGTGPKLINTFPISPGAMEPGGRSPQAGGRDTASFRFQGSMAPWPVYTSAGPVAISPAPAGVFTGAGVAMPMAKTELPDVIDPERKTSRIDLVTSRFHKENIYLYGGIDEDSALAFQLQMEHLMDTYPLGADGRVDPATAAQRPIRVFINSPGGYVSDMTIFLDMMDEAKRRGIIVETQVMGLAASAAAVIAANGTRGHRHASPNSRIMIHQPLGGRWGQETDVAIYAKYLKEWKSLLIDSLTENTFGRRTKRQVAAALERDHWMQPSEALDFGLIDCIGPGRPNRVTPPNLTVAPDPAQSPDPSNLRAG